MKIHYLWEYKGEKKYLCNWWIEMRKEYATENKAKVTCANCRRILSKFEGRLEEYEKQKGFFPVE